ncbi:hypothetical protein F3Y22_tig00117056pilonHSYRG01052 [Hibiscus syriacus]|uniref:Uncharacterized protein n=1 Tax=Hibiscus syriacus TaxID=106335 RepID=A0A6A2XBX3_HIBSY|nr:hypothetical protein F3Y22_tig00117056pilonHSYRG01052 [Hibiscus syriacus]
MKLKRRRYLEVPPKIRCFINSITSVPLENIEEPLKHFVWEFDKHLLSSLFASTDADVVEACLQTLAAFLKKTIGKYSVRDASLSSKMFALAQGWGGKEEGLGLIACAVQNRCDTVAYDLGCTLHFEFYASNEASSSEQSTRGLQIIHLPNINTYPETDLELLNKLVGEYKIPTNLRFSLLSRLRFARVFGSLTSRQQYTRIRLYAFIVLVQAGSDTDDLVSFFNNEPEFVNEVVTLLSYEDAVSEKIRILCMLSLVALCQDRSRQPAVLTAVTSGGHRGILSSLMQKAIDSVISNSSKWSVVFAEVLLSLVTALVSSSSGCSAMCEAGFIPTLLPLLKDTDPQHLHLVTTAVNIMEAFIDYSNPAATLFRDLGGLDDKISRLKHEVSDVENGLKQPVEDLDCCGRSSQVVAATSIELDNMQPLYSEALVSYHRWLLMKALLRAISLGTYAPGSTARVYGSEESLLHQCLYDAGLPSAFLDAIMDGVLCSAEAITCIPQCLDTFCLNNNGLAAMKDHNALRCFVNIFTSRTYLRSPTGDTHASLLSGLDELMRHASSLRAPGVDMVIEILNVMLRIGSGADTSFAAESSAPVSMETDAEERNLIQPDEGESSRIECSEQMLEPSSDNSSMSIELFLPDCISNVGRLLEAILQNADTCRLFVEKKGIDVVLQFFTLPLLPLSASVGQSISAAFKNFSPQHSASLARAVCSFLREQLKSTKELVTSIGGTQLAIVETETRTKNFYSAQLTLRNKVSLTKTIASKLSPAQRKMFEDTCFGPWLKVQHPGGDAMLTHLFLQTMTRDLLDTIQRRDKEIWFDFPPAYTCFGREEFCLITGLRFGHDDVGWYTRHITRPSWLSRVFPELERPNLHVEDLTILLNKKDGFTRMDDVDVVRGYFLEEETDLAMGRFTTEANTPLQRLTPTEAELATDWWQASKRFFDGTDDEQPPLLEPSPHPELSPHPERPKNMPRRLSPCSPPPPPRDELGELRDEVNALREEVGTLRKDDGAWRVEVSTLRGEVAALREMVASLQNEKNNSLLSQHENDYRNAEMAIAMRNENRNDKIAMRNENRNAICVSRCDFAVAIFISHCDFVVAIFIFRVAIVISALRYGPIRWMLYVGFSLHDGVHVSDGVHVLLRLRSPQWCEDSARRSPTHLSSLKSPLQSFKRPLSSLKSPPLQEATVIVEEVPPTISEPDSHGWRGDNYRKQFWIIPFRLRPQLIFIYMSGAKGVEDSDYFDGEHIDAWVSRLLIIRKLRKNKKNSRYTIMPAAFHAVHLKNQRDESFSLGNGQAKLYPAWWEVDKVFIRVLECRHWLLVQLQLPSLKIIVYDIMINYISLSDLRDIIKRWSSHLAKFLDGINYWTHSGHKKPKKFNVTVVRDETVPQQSPGARGDCGPLVCMCLARLTTGSTEFLPPTDRDRASVGLCFRHYMAREIYSRRCLPASAL